MEVQHGLAVFHAQLTVQHIGTADEGGNEQVGRALVDVLGGAHLLDVALAHDRDAVRNSHGFFLVVGDVHIGDAHRVLDLLDDGAHLHAQLGVQVGQGLVHQQHIRLDH